MIISIDVEDERWQEIADLEGVSRTAVSATSPAADTRSVAILFTSDAEMRVINKEWRGKDKPTNVLSFPAAKMPVPKGEAVSLGDIVLAYETVFAEAQTDGKKATDHLTHLIVHGVLHLLGYDHENDDDATIMESKEREILATLDIADPYQS